MQVYNSHSQKNFVLWSAVGQQFGNEYNVVQNKFLVHAPSASMKNWQALQ